MAKTETEEIKDGWSSTKSAYINTALISDKISRDVVPSREFNQIRWSLNKVDNFYDLTNHSKAKQILFIDKWITLII